MGIYELARTHQLFHSAQKKVELSIQTAKVCARAQLEGARRLLAAPRSTSFFPPFRCPYENSILGYVEYLRINNRMRAADVKCNDLYQVARRDTDLGCLLVPKGTSMRDWKGLAFRSLREDMESRSHGERI